MEENASFSKQEEVFDLSEIVEQGETAEHGSGTADDAEDAVIELTETVPAETASTMEKAVADSGDELDIHELVDIATDTEPEGSVPETGASAGETDADVLDLLADDIDDARLELPGMEEKPAPEVAGGLFPAAAEAEESAEHSGPASAAGSLSQCGEGKEASVPSETPDGLEGKSDALTGSAPSAECECSTEDAVPPTPSAPLEEEKDIFLSLAADLEARLNELTARHEAEAQALMARLDAAEQRASACEALAEEQQRRLVSELEALTMRLAAAEQRNDELAAKAAVLEGQLEACSARVVDMEALRLELEASTGRMVDERLSAMVPAEEAGTDAEATEVESSPEADLDEAGAPCEAEAFGAGDAPADESVRDEAGASEGSVPAEGVVPLPDEEGIFARVDDIAEQVGALEARVAGWELRCEQEAALAASRVIREEIAALRADAARTGR